MNFNDDWYNFEMPWVGGSLLRARLVCDGEWYVSQLDCLDPISRLRIHIPQKELPMVEKAILARWNEEHDNE